MDITFQQYVDRLSTFEPAQAQVGVVVWRLATEMLNQIPRAEFPGGRLDRVKFASNDWGRDWLVINTRDRAGIYPEVVGGDLVPTRDWYVLENPQGVKSGERWMQLRPQRLPTLREVEQLADDLLDLYDRLRGERCGRENPLA